MIPALRQKRPFTFKLKHSKQPPFLLKGFSQTKANDIQGNQLTVMHAQTAPNLVCQYRRIESRKDAFCD